MSVALAAKLVGSECVHPRRSKRRVAAAGGVLLAMAACAERVPPRPSAVPPVIAGLATTGAPAAELPARTRGLVLLGELGCVACHAQGTPGLVEVAPGPDLATLGGRLRADYARHFLSDPLVVEPGTRMPDLLHALAPAAAAQAAGELAAYLASCGPRQSGAELGADAAAVERGHARFHAVGCVACHAPRDAAGVEQNLPGSVPLGPLGAKYTGAGLRDFLLAPHAARPAARMPDFRLSPADAHDLASFLLGAVATPAPVAARADEAALVTAGRARFAALRCANCHELADPARPAAPPVATLRELDPRRGCLSGTAGAWPFYALTAAQRADLTAALAALAEPLAPEQRIAQRLVARNCLACHQRGDLGGIAVERLPLFGTDDPSLGLESRMPPPLTGVGGKLQPAWLADAIAFGQAERPYLYTRMPGFGAAFAAEVTGLLEQADAAPGQGIAALPTDEAQARAMTDLGRDLCGERGMNCISCHTFAGERAGAMGAIDLVATTAQRLRPEWFAQFLRQPFRFKPGTLMPQFFPDGVSVRPELGGGDATRQIEAMWHYLAQGRNVGKPPGMRRQPIELVVGAEAVLLRRSVQHTGKRGISVGYPGGVNLTFDAERLAVNQLWWGRFAEASGVFTSQGHGEVRLLGKERIELPPGPACVMLPEPDAPWPEASRRELGQQFLGYDLDAQQRPTFRYTCGEVTIADACREMPVEGGRPRLQRTLQATSANAHVVTLRALRAPQIDDLGGGVLRAGALRLQAPVGSFRIVAAGDQRELRVALPSGPGAAALVLDYTWQEAPK